jgi:hypothetical protein
LYRKLPIAATLLAEVGADAAEVEEPTTGGRAEADQGRVRPFRRPDDLLAAAADRRWVMPGRAPLSGLPIFDVGL